MPRGVTWTPLRDSAFSAVLQATGGLLARRCVVSCRSRLYNNIYIILQKPTLRPSELAEQVTRKRGCTIYACLNCVSRSMQC